MGLPERKVLMNFENSLFESRGVIVFWLRILHLLLSAFAKSGATPILEVPDLRVEFSRLSAFMIGLFFCTIQRWFSIHGPEMVLLWFVCFERNAALSVALSIGGPSCLFEPESFDVSSSSMIMFV